MIMITEDELITTLAELKGQPNEMVKCLFKYFPSEKEYTLNGYVRLLEDVLLVDEEFIKKADNDSTFIDLE